MFIQIDKKNKQLIRVYAIVVTHYGKDMKKTTNIWGAGRDILCKSFEFSLYSGT
jgi:hypothetical protein